MSGRKGGRPDLGDLDLSDLPRPLRGADPGEIERRRALASTLESKDFLAESTRAGIVKVVRPTPPAPSSGTQPRKRRSDEPNFTVRLPDSVQQAVRMRAVMEKTTVRLILLRALRDAGFVVADEDMTDDRGIVSKQRARGG